MRAGSTSPTRSASSTASTPSPAIRLEKGSKAYGYHYSRGSQGSPVLADGKIYVSETGSKFYILEAGDKGCETLHTQEFCRTAWK